MRALISLILVIFMSVSLPGCAGSVQILELPFSKYSEKEDLMRFLMTLRNAHQKEFDYNNRLYEILSVTGGVLGVGGGVYGYLKDMSEQQHAQVASVSSLVVGSIAVWLAHKNYGAKAKQHEICRNSLDKQIVAIKFASKEELPRIIKDLENLPEECKFLGYKQIPANAPNVP
jgi:hypothetical protein